MAIIACGTFLGGTLGPTPHKIAVVMTVTVFHSVILCQYVGCTPLGCQVGLHRICGVHPGQVEVLVLSSIRLCTALCNAAAEAANRD